MNAKLRRAVEPWLKAALDRGYKKGFEAGKAEVLAGLSAVAHLNGSFPKLVKAAAPTPTPSYVCTNCGGQHFAAEDAKSCCLGEYYASSSFPKLVKAQWDENKHPRDHGKFSSKPGADGDSDDQPDEWDGATIDQGEVDSANTPWAEQNAYQWFDGDGVRHEIWLEEGRYTPPGHDEPVTVYRFVSFDGDDRDDGGEGEWVADLDTARDQGEEFARGRDQDPPEPEDDDIDDVTGERWNSRRIIATWADSDGDEKDVRLEEGEFEFRGRTYTCYRWTTRNDDDGEWTLDKRQAIVDGKEYAAGRHVEPQDDGDPELDDDPEFNDDGGDKFDLDSLPPPGKRDVALAGEKMPKSLARLEIGNVDAGEANTLIGKVFGTATPEEGHAALVASLGMPDDAVVKVTRVGDYQRLFSDDKPKPGAQGVRVMVDHPKMGRVARFVGVDHEGRRFIRNEIVEIKPQYQGEGLGADIFARQVESAASEGIDYIETHAAGSSGGSMNGYYTWPRFGYDQRLDDPASTGRVFAAARERFPAAQTILDVMATQEGRDWWKKNGTDLHNARFDLEPDSRSMQVLAAYARERAAKKNAPGVVTKSYSPPSKMRPSMPRGKVSAGKALPHRGDDADPHAAVLLAMLDYAAQAREAGKDPARGVAALHALLDDPADLARVLDDGDVTPGTVTKAAGALILKAAKWDADKHPRDDAGRFVSRDQIAAAKDDPAKAEALRERVTDPAQRKKLDAALAGDTDLGRTKKGEAKHQAGQRRQAAADRKAAVDDLLKRAAGKNLRADALTADDLAAFADHIPNMTVAELRRARQQLGASFGGSRKRDGMVSALLAHAHAAGADATRSEFQADPDKAAVLAEAVAAYKQVHPDATPEQVEAIFGLGSAGTPAVDPVPAEPPPPEPPAADADQPDDDFTPKGPPLADPAAIAAARRRSAEPPPADREPTLEEMAGTGPGPKRGVRDRGDAFSPVRGDRFDREPVPASREPVSGPAPTGSRLSGPHVAPRGVSYRVTDELGRPPSPETQAKIDRVVGGLPPDHLAALANAPDGAAVRANYQPWDDSVMLTASQGKGDGQFLSQRILSRGEDGKLQLTNDQILIGKNHPLKGKGIESFANQVRAAKAAGVDRLVTSGQGTAADQTSDEAMNGYYTWPRAGYDGDIPEEYLSQLPPDLKAKMGGKTNIGTLMETPEGRAWWKANGGTLDLTFDLADNSPNMRKLEAYLAERAGGKARPAGTPGADDAATARAKRLAGIRAAAEGKSAPKVDAGIPSGAGEKPLTPKQQKEKDKLRRMAAEAGARQKKFEAQEKDALGLTPAEYMAKYGETGYERHNAQEHRRLVHAAVARGETVPDRVLMQYPDLHRDVRDAAIASKPLRSHLGEKHSAANVDTVMNAPLSSRGQRLNVETGSNLEGFAAQSAKEHYDAVKRRLAAGKPVPPEVLADYSDLAPKSPAPLTPQSLAASQSAERAADPVNAGLAAEVLASKDRIRANQRAADAKRKKPTGL